jgi:beta-galactosidase/beta-glucuronidase
LLSFACEVVRRRALEAPDIQTEVQNANSVAKSCTVQTDIADATGTIVTSVTSTQMVAANTTVTFSQTTPTIANPALWHPDHPTLYQTLSTVSDGATPVDNYTANFGFRWFSWSASTGFTLNGSHHYIHGVDVHQDHAGWVDGGRMPVCSAT